MPFPVLIVLHQEHSTPGRLGHALQQLGYTLDVRRPRFDEALPATTGHFSEALARRVTRGVLTRDRAAARNMPPSWCRPVTNSIAAAPGNWRCLRPRAGRAASRSL